jgi:hypothetical protein
MVEADELLVYPGLAELGLSGLCEYLERSGARALEAPLIDMYGDGPVMQGTYTLGQPFIEACPYLDAKAPRERRVDDWCPPTQLFGGVRERIFWRGRFARTQPPTLSKVPLVKWRKGMAYSASTHLISRTTLSELRGGLLHFKFLPGFFNDLIAQIEKNRTGVEKSLQERAAYYDGLMRNPNLAFRDEHSVRYESPEQLVRLGWLRTSPAFERYVAEKSRVPLKRAAADVTRSPRRRQPVGSAPTTDRAGG